MLVLSRRANETIRFPQLGISVSIVSVKGNRVQVGVDAPPEIQVLRKELELTTGPILGTQVTPANHGSSVPTSLRQSAKEKHDFKNRLNRATLGVHLAQKQLAAGQVQAADQSLSTALERLMELEKAAIASIASEAKPIRLSAYSSSSEWQDDTRTRLKDASVPCIDVLLVEDDQNEQALMRTLLEMEGYRVHTASNGIEALQCLERITPQCVLLDMLMPDCDGRETCERMRAIPSFDILPIFAVSGTSPESVGLSMGTGGIDDWFPKPLNAPRLVQYMRNRIACLSS